MKKLKLDLKFSTFEFAAATATTTKAKLVFVVIYRPGSQALREPFFSELTTLFDVLVTYSADIVITGDFNIHVDKENNSHTRKLNDLLSSFDLVQSVTGPTHLAGHTLDLVITRSGLTPPI